MIHGKESNLVDGDFGLLREVVLTGGGRGEI